MNDAIDPHVDEAQAEAAGGDFDRDTFLRLLQEYTQKLQEAVAEATRVKVPLRELFSGSLGVGAILILGYSIVFLAPEPFASTIGSLTVMVGLVLALIYFGCWTFVLGIWIFKPSSFRKKYGISDSIYLLYSVLDRLIRLGSGRAEHAALGFDERLEFELRLAEAEAVLRLAEKLLARSPRDEQRLHELRDESRSLRDRLAGLAEGRSEGGMKGAVDEETIAPRDEAEPSRNVQPAAELPKHATSTAA